MVDNLNEISYMISCERNVMDDSQIYENSLIEQCLRNVMNTIWAAILHFQPFEKTFENKSGSCQHWVECDI